MAETQSSAGGSSLSKVSGDSLLNLLLSRIDAMCADIKSVREENKAIINKVDLSEKILKETLSSLQKETINNKKDHVDKITGKATLSPLQTTLIRAKVTG